jgi:hypothetical protein
MQDGRGDSRYAIANLVDVIGGGCGMALMTPLVPGSTVILRGAFSKSRTLDSLRAGVKWCVPQNDGTFRAGLEFLDQRSSFIVDEEPAQYVKPVGPDCYEVMQLSPNADAETISRVYRLLAFRYHPDNAETGNSETFLRLREAYQILCHPEKRASYDAAYRGGKRTSYPAAANGDGGHGEKQRNREVVMAAYLEVRPLECTVCWEG